MHVVKFIFVFRTVGSQEQRGRLDAIKPQGLIIRSPGILACSLDPCSFELLGLGSPRIEAQASCRLGVQFFFQVCEDLLLWSGLPAKQCRVFACSLSSPPLAGVDGASSQLPCC